MSNNIHNIITSHGYASFNSKIAEEYNQKTKSEVLKHMIDIYPELTWMFDRVRFFISENKKGLFND